MKYANKIGAKFVCVLGDNELESGEVKIKNMRTGEESPASLADIASGFTPLILNEIFETEGLESALDSTFQG